MHGLWVEQNKSNAMYVCTEQVNSYQLVNEAEYLMKNYGDQGGCYGLDGEHPPRSP